MDENLKKEIKELVKEEVAGLGLKVDDKLKEEIKELIKETIADLEARIDETLKNEIRELVKETIADLGSKIDDKVEKTADKYQVPKWVVWLSGLAAAGAAISFIF